MSIDINLPSAAEPPIGWPTEPPPQPSMQRLALGISFRGAAYCGWQSQRSGCGVQDVLERALAKFAALPQGSVGTVCAGRTDTGVHGLLQVVHLDTPLQRDAHGWVRGVNSFLPRDVAVQWCQPVPAHFHARNSARGRRYTYVLLESPVRPALEAGLVGWTFRPLNAQAMQLAADALIGEHDFSAFRAAACQASSPVKTLRQLQIQRQGAYWLFHFDGNAFLHHMVRNIMGCLVAVGTEKQPPGWMAQLLAGRSRKAAAPTFSPDGLYFVGPYYDAAFGLPAQVPQQHWFAGPSLT